MGQSNSTSSDGRSGSVLQQSAPINPAQNFTYTPLALPRNFRILRLTWKRTKGSASWQDFALYGSIVEVSLDGAPEYFALSYTWGDPLPTDRICIDGRMLGITQNCADALRRMLKGKFKRMIWVDSICINQAKDDAQALQERGRQVALMDEIYSKATQDNAHLRPGDKRSDAAIAVVKRLYPSYLAALVAKNTGIAQESMRRRYEEIAADALATSPDFPYGRLHGLFRLPWFRRTWVVQEVALARKVTFYCGEHLLAFDNLAAAADFTRLPYSRVDATARHWKLYLDWHHSLAEFIRRRDQGEDVRATVGLDLQYLFTGATLLDATRPEDKIYGLYGCAKRLGLDLPVPDYTKSVAQVYTGATLAGFRQGGNLDLLQMVEGAAAAQFELPSWVPNLSESYRRSSLDNPPKVSGPLRTNRSVSGATECQWMIMPDQRRLKVLGRRLDHIEAISEAWKMDARTTLLGDAATNSGQIFVSLLACIGTWLDVLVGLHSGNGHEFNAIAAVQELYNLFVNGHAMLVKPPDRMVEHLSVLIDAASACHRGDQAYLSHLDAELASNSQLGQDLQRAVEYLILYTWKLVFRTTTKAYLGIGSYSCQPGDLVVVFHGMGTPVVIRPCAGGFNFVGTAFVNRTMDGEFWSVGSEADDEWFVLLRTPTEEAAVGGADEKRIEELAHAFGAALPSGTLSPAEIQGYLMLHRNDPKAAVDNARAWAEEVIATKARGTNVSEPSTEDSTSSEDSSSEAANDAKQDSLSESQNTGVSSQPEETDLPSSRSPPEPWRKPLSGPIVPRQPRLKGGLNELVIRDRNHLMLDRNHFDETRMSDDDDSAV